MDVLDVESEFPVPLLHPYQLHFIDNLITPYFFKFVLIIPGTGKNRELRCEHICLPTFNFCARKKFFQVELG